MATMKKVNKMEVSVIKRVEGSMYISAIVSDVLGPVNTNPISLAYFDCLVKL